MAANLAIMPTYFMVAIFVTRLISALKLTKKSTNPPPPNKLNHHHSFPAETLRSDPAAVSSAATDYGNMVHRRPAVVPHPSSVDDIVTLIKLAYNGGGFTVAARGRGHSVRGQAMVERSGVVVDMMQTKRACRTKIGDVARNVGDIATHYRDVACLPGDIDQSLHDIANFLKISV